MGETTREGEELMRRRKQITGWVALGLAIAATVPAMAQSRPSPSQNQVRQPMELGLSEGKIQALGLLEESGMKSQDDRSFPTTANADASLAVSETNRQPMELGLSEGKIRALGLLEQSGMKSQDDRSFPTTANVDPTPVVVSDVDRSIDVNAYTVSGFGVVLLFAMAVGMGIVAVWHSRGTKLTPA
jgi:hypothetical protein